MFFLHIVLLLSTLINGTVSDLAIGKPTSSSSNPGDTGQVVDGDNNPDYAGNSCWASSVGDANPYWMVDLQANHFLGHVRLTNRGDCCGDGLHDLQISVFADDPSVFPNAESYLCAMYDGPMPLGATEDVLCACLTRGRYLRIDGLNRQNEDDQLTLCEVETYSHCYKSTLRRLMDTRFVGGAFPVDVTSTAECARACTYNSTCNGFNFNNGSLLCELTNFNATTSNVTGWSHYLWEYCE